MTQILHDSAAYKARKAAAIESELATLRAQRDALRDALKTIAELRMAGANGPHSMAMEAVDIARAALDGAK